MRPLTWLKVGLLCVAGVGSYFGAVAAVGLVERRGEAAVTAVLEDAGMGWVTVRPDGMRVVLSGIAPDEATRFRVVTLAGRATNPANLRDEMTVLPPEDLPLLAFKAELMRNADSVLMLGLVPEGPENDLDIAARVAALVPGMEVSDIMTRSISPMPDYWPVAAEIGLAALGELENVRVVITPETVSVEGIAPADIDPVDWTDRLKARAPDAVTVEVALRQPRQRLSPFTMQLVKDGEGLRISTCAVESEADAERVSKALMAQGGASDERCRIALGAPDAAWPEVAEAAIASLAEMGSGAITISDQSVTVLPDADVSPETLSAQGEALRQALPESYQLSLLETKSISIGDEGPQLSLSRGENGSVTLRGPLPSAQDQAVLASLAAARFGTDNLTRITRIENDLPSDWALRAMAATEVLAYLRDGTVDVTPERITISGTSTDPDAGDKITAKLTETLGTDAAFMLDVTYEEPVLEETAIGPAPEACVAEVNAILLENKITFDPGSVELGADGLKTVDAVAELLQQCPDVSMEIGGHTDSQGREEMNQLLSQARAEAVLAALAQRRVLTSNFSAKGYGETQPIADNSSEAGREANRRIAFRLTSPGEDDPQRSVDGSE